MTKPRPWTTETLMKRVGAYLSETNLTDTDTIGDLFDSLEATIIFEKTGIDRRKPKTGQKLPTLEEALEANRLSDPDYETGS